MKVDLSGDAFSPLAYNRDNGQGAAQAAITALRQRIAKDPARLSAEHLVQEQNIREYAAGTGSKVSLESTLLTLCRAGCNPGLYLRGQVWRAHVNCGGNHWADHEFPVEALAIAFKSWCDAGRPADGAAEGAGWEASKRLARESRRSGTSCMAGTGGIAAPVILTHPVAGARMGRGWISAVN